MKNVNIATFSVNKHSIAPRMSYTKMADKCIDFWNERFTKLTPHKPDIIIMPECFNRPAKGLSPEKTLEYYDEVSESTLNFIADTAKNSHSYIVCNQARKFNNNWYNTSTVFDRNGLECGCYRKNFLTPTEHTDNKMEYGRNAELIETDFGHIACVTCFDLNFDQLREYYSKAKPDLLVFSSMYHGGVQQLIWSWLCRCHFVGAMGRQEIPGEIRNPFGEILYSTTNYFDYVCGTVNLDYKIVHLDYNWKKLDKLKEKYSSNVTIYDPGYFGCVLVSSNSEQVSSLQMLEEFDIADYDTYLEQSIEIRNIS